MMVVGCRLRSRKGSAAASISPARMITLVVPSPTWGARVGAGRRRKGQAGSSPAQGLSVAAGKCSRKQSRHHAHMAIRLAYWLRSPCACTQAAGWLSVHLARLAKRPARPAAARGGSTHLLVLGAAELDDGLGSRVADVNLAQDGVAVVGQHDAAVGVQQHFQHGAGPQRSAHNVGHRLLSGRVPMGLAGGGLRLRRPNAGKAGVMTPDDPSLLLTQ